MKMRIDTINNEGTVMNRKILSGCSLIHVGALISSFPLALTLINFWNVIRLNLQIAITSISTLKCGIRICSVKQPLVAHHGRRIEVDAPALQHAECNLAFNYSLPFAKFFSSTVRLFPLQKRYCIEWKNFSEVIPWYKGSNAPSHSQSFWWDR